MLREQLEESRANQPGAASHQEIPMGSSQPNLIPVSPDEHSEGEQQSSESNEDAPQINQQSFESDFESRSQENFSSSEQNDQFQRDSEPLDYQERDDEEQKFHNLEVYSQTVSAVDQLLEEAKQYVSENAYREESGENLRNSQTHVIGGMEWTTLENNVI